MSMKATTPGTPPGTPMRTITTHGTTQGFESPPKRRKTTHRTTQGTPARTTSEVYIRNPNRVSNIQVLFDNYQVAQAAATDHGNGQLPIVGGSVALLLILSFLVEKGFSVEKLLQELEKTMDESDYDFLVDSINPGFKTLDGTGITVDMIPSRVKRFLSLVVDGKRYDVATLGLICDNYKEEDGDNKEIGIVTDKAKKTELRYQIASILNCDSNIRNILQPFLTIRGVSPSTSSSHNDVNVSGKRLNFKFE